MPSAGELLRRERLTRNRSISDIARETCICSRYLHAIEEDNPKVLPGDFFHRSFIRQYARVLGMEESQIREILDSVDPPAEIDLAPTFSIPQQIADVEQSCKPLAHISTRVAAMLLVVVLAGCSGLYALWNRAQEAADPAMQVAPTVTAAPAAASPTQAEPVATPKRTEVQPTHPEPDPTQGDSAQMDVNLAATEKTWVSLSSDGRTVYRGMLDPSESKHFAITEHARLLTGNAAALHLHVNGRALGPLGSRGQVRVVLLSQNNFQVLSPRKV
jgi:cytoskeleton protein RodZ